MKNFLAVVVVGLLSGCYASATSARIAQTKSANGWFCMDEPKIDCRGECSGWNNVWYASCGDKRYICKFNDQRNAGEIMTTDRRDEHLYRGVSCQAE